MKVQLLKPHTHARKALQPGAEIDVSEAELKLLLDHAVVEKPKKPRWLKAVPSGGNTTEEDQ